MSNQVRFFVFDDPTRQQVTALPVEQPVEHSGDYLYGTSIFLSVAGSGKSVERFVVADWPQRVSTGTGSVVTVHLARIRQWPYFSEPDRFPKMRQTNIEFQ